MVSCSWWLPLYLFHTIFLLLDCRKPSKQFFHTPLPMQVGETKHKPWLNVSNLTGIHPWLWFAWSWTNHSPQFKCKSEPGFVIVFPTQSRGIVLGIPVVVCLTERNQDTWFGFNAKPGIVVYLIPLVLEEKLEQSPHTQRTINSWSSNKVSTTIFIICLSASFIVVFGYSEYEMRLVFPFPFPL